MLTYSDLRKGIIFLLDGDPYQVLEYEFLRMQQRKPVTKTRLKNLINGKIIERNFHQNETFEEVEIEKESVKYLYNNRGQYWFSSKDNPSQRFFLTEELVGQAGKFFKPNTEVTVLKFPAGGGSASGGNDKIIQVNGPIKADLRVKETPPGERGDTATGGRKAAALESGAVVQVPLFVNEGDIVRINTDTGEYVERVEKSKG